MEKNKWARLVVVTKVLTPSPVCGAATHMHIFENNVQPRMQHAMGVASRDILEMCVVPQRRTATSKEYFWELSLTSSRGKVIPGDKHSCSMINQYTSS